MIYVISIVVPVFNEGLPLKSLCERIITEVRNLFDNYEIILVDDRSTDNTWIIMCQLAKGNKSIKIARFCRNFGQHSALTAGISMSRGDYIILMDCDGQDNPERIPALYKKLIESDAQIVYAKRKNKKNAFYKNTGSKIINRLIQILSGYEYDEEIGTFRIMRKIVAEAYLSMPEKNRYIGGMFFWLNFKSATFDVEHETRSFGKSNYNFKKLMKLARMGILSSSTKLLSIGTYIGLISSILSIIAGIYYLSLKLFFNVPLGFTAIIVSIFFVGSIIMLLLGIIGEYMREIFEEVKSRPNFIIEEKVNF